MKSLLEINERIDELADLIDDDVRGWERYYEENEENPYAAALMEGNFQLNLDSYFWDALDDELASRLRALQSTLSKRELKKLLIDCSDLTFVSDIYCREGEVGSVLLGEIDVELSDEVQSAVASLSDDERVALRKRIDHYASESIDYVLLNYDYCRWSLMIDEDRLAGALGLNR